MQSIVIVLSSSDIRKMNYLFSFPTKFPTKLFLKTTNNFSKEIEYLAITTIL